MMHAVLASGMYFVSIVRPREWVIGKVSEFIAYAELDPGAQYRSRCQKSSLNPNREDGSFLRFTIIISPPIRLQT